MYYAYENYHDLYLAFNTKKLRDLYCSDNLNAESVTLDYVRSHFGRHFVLDKSHCSGMYFLKR